VAATRSRAPACAARPCTLTSVTIASWPQKSGLVRPTMTVARGCGACVSAACTREQSAWPIWPGMLTTTAPGGPTSHAWTQLHRAAHNAPAVQDGLRPTPIVIAGFARVEC
jgi:hypothetical protein